MENIAEQRALEGAGLVREGRVRGQHFRDGRWRDSYIYGITRNDWKGDRLTTGVRIAHYSTLTTRPSAIANARTHSCPRHSDSCALLFEPDPSTSGEVRAETVR